MGTTLTKDLSVSITIVNVGCVDARNSTVPIVENHIVTAANVAACSVRLTEKFKYPEYIQSNTTNQSGLVAKLDTAPRCERGDYRFDSDQAHCSSLW